MSQNCKKSKIRVLVVEDSPVMQELITHILDSDAGLEVIGTASNSEEALQALYYKHPDVVTMDYHLPKMNGLDLTRKIMETHPLPIIMVSSSIVHNEAMMAFRVLDAGAVTVTSKPVGINHPDYEKEAKALVQTVKSMAEVKMVRRWPKQEKSIPATRVRLPKNIKFELKEVKLVAIGASTGGPTVLKKILSNLPSNFPIAMLIVQHIAKGFTQSLADWLTQSTGFLVHVALSGERPQPGHAYLAPDGFHMQIAKNGCLELNNNSPVNGHRPSVAILFRSVATIFGRNAIGVLLTGMGNDGAAELKLMKEQGALTIAQDQETSVIYGMPGEAIKLDAATVVLKPSEIAAILSSLAKEIKR